MSLVVVFTNDGTGHVLKGSYDVGTFINERQIWKGRLEYVERGNWKDLIERLAYQFREEQNEKG